MSRGFDFRLDTRHSQPGQDPVVQKRVPTLASGWESAETSLGTESLTEVRFEPEAFESGTEDGGKNKQKRRKWMPKSDHQKYGSSSCFDAFWDRSAAENLSHIHIRARPSLRRLLLEDASPLRNLIIHLDIITLIYTG